MKFDRLEYWKNPADKSVPRELRLDGSPEFYLKLDGITDLVVSMLEKYLTPEQSILELGSGTGRNLAGLKRNGFVDVAGIELNERAVALGLQHFPELADVPVKIGAVESALKRHAKVDCIFTQGLLQHLPPDLDWIFATIAKKANCLVMVIENEWPSGLRSWARDYKTIFEGLGWVQVEARVNTGLKGHVPTTALRIFERVQDESRS